jgi:hypothetical protein
VLVTCAYRWHLRTSFGLGDVVGNGGAVFVCPWRLLGDPEGEGRREEGQASCSSRTCRGGVRGCHFIRVTSLGDIEGWGGGVP